MWCKCPAKERHDLSKMWSLTDRKHGACSTEEIIAMSSLPKSAERYNCLHPPVFPSIPIDHVVIDTLHLFLRITGLLTNLIQDLRSQDGIAKRTMFHTKATNMVTYEKFLNETCKIPFQWYVNPETKQLKWRDLTGPEKLRLFSTIQPPSTLSQSSTFSDSSGNWSSFFALYQELSKAANRPTLQPL